MVLEVNNNQDNNLWIFVDDQIILKDNLSYQDIILFTFKLIAQFKAK